MFSPMAMLSASLWWLGWQSVLHSGPLAAATGLLLEGRVATL
jgi:hypothetical protein